MLHQLNMADAWSQSAEAYVHLMKRTEDAEPRLDMAQGRSEVVRIVVNALAGKVRSFITRTIYCVDRSGKGRKASRTNWSSRNGKATMLMLVPA